MMQAQFSIPVFKNQMAYLVRHELLKKVRVSKSDLHYSISCGINDLPPSENPVQNINRIINMMSKRDIKIFMADECTKILRQKEVQG